MPEALAEPQTEQFVPRNEDLFGQVGVEGLVEVLKWKQGREGKEAFSPGEKAKIAISKVEDPRARQALAGALEDVVRIMTAVETIRSEATGKKPITDKDIYIAYRRLTESENPDPRFEQACKVLLNLMGGNISGKLPF